MISGLDRQGVASEGEERWVWTRGEADSEMQRQRWRMLTLAFRRKTSAVTHSLSHSGECCHAEGELLEEA